MRLIVPVLLAVLGAACSSSGKDVLPPAALTPIENPLIVHSQWQDSRGNGVSENYLKLGPIVHEGTGYIADYTGYVRSFDALSGELKWEVEMDRQLASGPAIAEGLLIFGTSQGEVIALKPENGQPVWQAQVSSEVLAPARGAQDVIIIRTVDGRVHALNAESGQHLWVYDRNVPLLTLRGLSTPAINNDMVIVGTDNGKLVALTLNGGTVLWETQVAVPSGRTELERMVDIDADPVIVEDVAYVVTYQGRLAAVRLENGRILWVQDISSYSGMALDPYRVYLTDSDSQVWALNRFNGSTLWRQDKLLRRSLTGPELSGKYLVVADYDGYLHWIRRADGVIVARRQINAGYYLFEDPEQIEEDDKMFPKANNVLVTPVKEKDLILTVDRLGHLEAFHLQQPE